MCTLRVTELLSGHLESPMNHEVPAPWTALLRVFFQCANMHSISTLTLFDQNATEPSLVLFNCNTCEGSETSL